MLMFCSDECVLNLISNIFVLTCLIMSQAAKALEKNLKASGVPHEVHMYPGNSHAFMNRSPEGTMRRKNMGMLDEDGAAIQLAWSRFNTWMIHHLS